MGQRTTGRHTNAHTRRLRVPGGALRGPARGQRAYAAACRSSPPPRAARARSSSCSRPSRCIAATRPAGTASTAHTSRARLRAPLPLLLRRLLLPLPLPREREGGFVDDHRLSTKSSAVTQERVDDTAFRRQYPGGKAGVARALRVAARRSRHQGYGVGQRLHHQRPIGTNHVKMFTVGEVWTIFHDILPSGGRGREG